jgi:hypothetical protein
MRIIMPSLIFLDTVDAAKLAAKKEFGHHCLKTGMHYKDLNAHGLTLECCHLFQISTFPNLETCIQNLYPLNSRDHRDRRVDCLDYITYKDSGGWAITRNRTPQERVQWLLKNGHPDYSHRVRNRIYMLIDGLNSIDPEISAIAEAICDIL